MRFNFLKKERAFMAMWLKILFFAWHHLWTMPKVKRLENDLLQVAIYEYFSVGTTNLPISIHSTRHKLPRTSHHNPQFSISSIPFQKPYRQKGLTNGEKVPHFIHFNDVHKKSEHASQWPIETISNYLQTHSELYVNE